MEYPPGGDEVVGGRTVTRPELPLVVRERVQLLRVPHVVGELRPEVHFGGVGVPGGIQLHLVDLLRVLLHLDRRHVRADDERIRAEVVRVDGRARDRVGVRADGGPVGQRIGVRDQGAAGVAVRPQRRVRAIPDVDVEVAVGAVRVQLRGGLSHVEPGGPVRIDVPTHVQARGVGHDVVFGDEGVEVRGPVGVGEVGDRAVCILHDIADAAGEAPEPGAVLPAVGVFVVGCEVVVERHHDRIAWMPLQGDPAVLAARVGALEVHGLVLDVPARGHARAGGAGADRRAAGAGWIGLELGATEVRPLPAHDVEVVAEDVLVRVVPADQDAERAVGKSVAHQGAEGRPHSAVVLVIGGGTEDTRLEALMVERIGELDVDGCADGARREAEIGRLEDVDLSHVLGAERAEVEALARAGGDLATLDQCLVELRPESTDGDARRSTRGRRCAGRGVLIDGSAVHGHPGDARDGLTERGIRELTDVLRGDRVHDADRVLLDVHALLQGGTDTCNDDFLQLIGLLCRGCRGTVLREDRAGHGAQGQCGNRPQSGSHDFADLSLRSWIVHSNLPLKVVTDSSFASRLTAATSWRLS